MSTFVTDDSNDFALTRNARGKLSLSLERDEVVCGAYKLYRRGQLFEGEWFLDTRIGMPYFRLVLVKNPDLSVVRRVFYRWLTSVQVVAKVVRIDIDYQRAARRMGMDFELFAIDGRRINGGFNKPFIVTGPDLNSANGTNNGDVST